MICIGECDALYNKLDLVLDLTTCSNRYVGWILTFPIHYIINDICIKQIKHKLNTYIKYILKWINV